MQASFFLEGSTFGSFKINFDGAIFLGENKSKIGVVVYDSQGLVIASLSQ